MLPAAPPSFPRRRGIHTEAAFTLSMDPRLRGMTAVALCMSAALASEKIEFWTFSMKPKFTPYFETLVKTYEAGNPGVKVEWVDFPWDVIQTKLVTPHRRRHAAGAGQPERAVGRRIRPRRPACADRRPAGRRPPALPRQHAGRPDLRRQDVRLPHVQQRRRHRLQHPDLQGRRHSPRAARPGRAAAVRSPDRPRAPARPACAPRCPRSTA